MKRTCWTFSFCCLLLLTTATPAQAQVSSPDVEIRGVRPLAPGSTPFRQVEPYLAVDPTDPENMLASAMAHTDSLGGSVVYMTRNGGADWEVIRPRGGLLFPGGDPMVDFGQNGRAYLSTLASGFSLWRSEDGGASWQGPTQVEGNFDREWVAVGSASSRGKARIYAAVKDNDDPNAIVAFVSRDGGKSFEELTRLSQDTATLHAPMALAISEKGELFLPYRAFYGSAPGEKGLLQGQRRILVSWDRGRTWAPPRRVGPDLTYGNDAGEALALKGLGIGGLALDESAGAKDGRIYLTWTHVIDGFIQVVVARSRTGGRSWGDPVRVNQGGHHSHHSTPQVAVNQHGTVAVTWNDRRHDPDGQCYHHFVAVSRDAGRTFQAERRISSRETCFPSDYRWQNGGDTNGLAALPDGRFRTVWIGPGPKGPRPWTARILPR